MFVSWAKSLMCDVWLSIPLSGNIYVVTPFSSSVFCLLSCRACVLTILREVSVPSVTSQRADFQACAALALTFWKVEAGEVKDGFFFSLFFWGIHWQDGDIHFTRKKKITGEVDFAEYGSFKIVKSETQWFFLMLLLDNIEYFSEARGVHPAERKHRCVEVAFH